VSPQHRGEETRYRILKAAEESFAQHGYDGTAVAQICHRAGVTKGAFYHHFPSKQALFLELLNRWLAGLDARLDTACAAEPTVPERLLCMARMTQKVFREASGQLPILLEFWSQAARDPIAWQATIAPYRRYRAFFAKMIETGIAETPHRPTDGLTGHCLTSSGLDTTGITRSTGSRLGTGNRGKRAHDITRFGKEKLG